MHCEKSKGILPKEMEEFVKTKERFVFISFGSAIRISALPEDNQKIWFETLESIKDTNFLMKWEAELPKNIPKNILAQNWFPQQDVLAHPKCKGFISQVGVMSYQQAVFHGVPLIAVPMWADQNYAAHSAEYHGNGINLELADINKETLTEALHEILDNKRYIDTAKEMSKRFKDRPMSAVDTAVWWTEYVLRHDTAHLKSPAIQQYWWQRRLLDFWGVVFIGILVIVYTTAKILSVVVRTAIRSNAKSSSEKVKQS
jgi:UDP:flavonoid glycosyltransferase YjiC (YdhE family)